MKSAFEDAVKGQMTLGTLLDRLASFDQDLPVEFDDGNGVVETWSYQGHYERLGLSEGEDAMSVSQLVTMLSAANAATMAGYKGGDNVMHREMLLWQHEYGTTCGLRWIVGAEQRATEVVLLTRDAPQ